MKFKNIYKKIIIIFILFIAILFWQSELRSLFVLLFILYTYFFYKIAKTNNKKYILLLLAFTIRVIIIILDNFYGLFPYIWDTQTFHNTSLLIKENILAFRPLFYNINTSISVKSYSFFSSIIYLIFGNHEIIMRILNAFIGVYIAKQAYDISLMAKLNKNSAYWVLNLVAFWPSFVLYTSINMRDALIICLTLDLIKKIFLLMDRKKINLLFILFDFILIYYLRRQNVFLFIIIILFYYVIKRILKSKKLYRIIFILLSFVGFISFIYLIQLNILPVINIDYISGAMEHRTSGGASYLKSISYNNTFEVIKYIPIRSVYFLFGPFIWDLSVKNIFILFAFIESFVFFILFILGRKGLLGKNNLYNSKLLFLLTFLITGVAGYASITSNYGTAIRHKMTFIIIIFIFISKSFSRYKLKIFN